MKKTIHDEDCECVVCENDYFRSQNEELKSRNYQLNCLLQTERDAITRLSEYKSAKDALVDVAGIKQAVARQCIEMIRAVKSTRAFNAERNELIREIESEFGI